LAKNKFRFAIFILVLLISAILENLGPYFYKLLINNIREQNYQLLMKFLLAFVGLRVVSNLFNILSHQLGDWVAIPTAKDIQLTVFKKVQDLDFAYHVNKSTGSLISAFKRGDGAFWSLFFSLHHNIFKTLISLLITLFFFSTVSYQILWIMLGLFIVNVSISFFLIKFNLSKRRAFNKEDDELSGIITDNLLNYETVKFFAQEKKEENRIKDKFITWTDKVWHYVQSFRLMDFTVGTISSLGMFLIFYIVIDKLKQNLITIGDFIMVAGFMTGFYYRFFDLLYQFREIGKKFVDLEKYFGILDQKVIVKDPIKPQVIENFKAKIDFENVYFSYPDKREKILQGINLHIKPGESIAFVGRSGAGKTTIIKLLLRFYDVNKGVIKVSNTDIKNLKKNYLRSFIGVVPQEPILFNNTIEFNIGYASIRPTKKEIIKAAKIANLHDFITSLPKNYKTIVGERGIKLSGGQKQRLAIARAILADPKIIIFDEATSNLDSESEGLVQDALWSSFKGKTVLIIAHRFSTIRKADRIIVLEKGRVAEVGSHKQLIAKKNSLYRHLWQLQAKGKVDLDNNGLTKEATRKG